MNRIDSDLRVSSVARVAPAPASSSIAEPQRLVVVVREAEDEALLASRIFELNRPHGRPVLLMGVAPDSSEEAALRRKLVTIAAFLREQKSGKERQPAPVEIRVERGRDWLGRIKSQIQPGDAIACYSGQTVGVLERPLSDLLSSSLAMPIYTFMGLDDRPRRRHNHLAQVASWVGSLASIAGFFALQARIVIAVQGWMQSALLLISLAAEMALIWVLNSLLAQS